MRKSEVEKEMTYFLAHKCVHVFHSINNKMDRVSVLQQTDVMESRWGAMHVNSLSDKVFVHTLQAIMIFI